MPSSHWDLIVIGAGAVGSAAMWRAATRGLRVLGLDRFPAGHDRGSSHGRTRIIRQAYFEHADYVPLLLRAYDLWAELEAARGEKLLHQTGLLQVGPADGFVVPGVLASAARHGLAVEALTAAECRKRFPAFRVPDECCAAFEKKAGYLPVERCVIAQIDEAIRQGASLESGVAVHGWQEHADRVAVTTDRGTFSADRVIVTAGAWANDLLRELGVPLIVRRKPQFWFATRDASYDVDRGTPAYLYETPRGVFYGFPRLDEHGVKVAEHSGGDEVADPLNVDRTLHVADLMRVQEFTGIHLLLLGQEMSEHKVCMYTMTPDEHFIVDRYPDSERIAFAAGLSGHGFKFAPVLGEALTQLALDVRSDLPIEFLSLRRFASRA